jgi:capsular exopolysaccharide synthesis family protein
LLLDWADATIKTPEDVAQLALLEPLGSIALRIEDPELTSDLSLDDNQLERAFSIINTNFHALNTGQRSLMVTSLHSRTGTTTVATRLAIALAQSGTHVLLVDAHLRKPELHTLFHLPNVRGLATVQADVQVLQKQPDQVYNWLNQWGTNEPNLWLLPAGSIMGNSTSVLRSRELRKLVGWLLQEQDASSNHKISSPVDIIIFDTPALEEEADTVTLAPLCDSSILVVEAGKERKETLKKAQATLQRLGAPVIGVVVNRQKASHRPYLYINQPQQGVFPVDAPSSTVSEVKYPLLKVQTLSVRAIPKISAPKRVEVVPEQEAPYKRASIVDQATITFETAQDVKPNHSNTPFKSVARTFVPSQNDKEQGGSLR